MIPLMEIPDIEGKDIIWYFYKFELFQLLDAKVMDKFINKKWKGRIETNNSFLDYSLSYNILQNKNEFFTSDKMLTEVKNQMLTFDKSHLTH